MDTTYDIILQGTFISHVLRINMKKNIYLNWILNLQVWTHYKITWTPFINIVPHPRYKSHNKSILSPISIVKIFLTTPKAHHNSFYLNWMVDIQMLPRPQLIFLSKTWFLEFIWIFSNKKHLKINISHILNPNLTK